jgi:peptidyl-prolyl cis-trans isomerase D
MIRFLQTPGPALKIMLGGILLIICGSMVITLVPGGIGSSFGLGNPGKGVVATVEGVDISSQEVQKQARQMVRQQFPRGGEQASMLLPFFANRAAEDLISRQIVLAEAERLGLRATDDEVRDELQHGRYAPVFFPGGTFVGQEAYEARLQQAEVTTQEFENEVKDQILFAKLHNLIAGSVAVTEAEIHQEFERRFTKVKFDYALLRRDDILKGLHPTEQELKAYYTRNQANYNNSIPEKRKIKYILLDAAKIQAQTQVSRPDLQSYYDQNQDEYRVAEQVNVRHILIKSPLPGPDGKVDPKGMEEARKKAEDVLKQLKAGANFADLAKKSSEDTGSAKEGGSLGWVGKGRTVPEFEKVAFSLSKGETSDLVQSSYGFHILHVDDKQPAHLKALEEVKAQIEPILKQQKAARAAEGQANALLAQARSAGIDKAAADKGLQAVTTDFFSRSDSLPGIGASPQFMETVFSETEKAPPDLAQLAQGYAVFELLEVKPPATPTFEEIRSRVEGEFKNERTSALLSQKTQELSDRAKAAHDLKKAARELGATAKTSDFVLPDGQVPDIGAMSGSASVAFGMKPGEISGPLEAGDSGAVLSVLEKQAPTAEDFTKRRDEVRDSLLQSKQGQLFQLYMSNLRQQMEKSGKVKINQQELKTLTRSQGEEGE